MFKKLLLASSLVMISNEINALIEIPATDVFYIDTPSMKYDNAFYIIRSAEETMGFIHRDIAFSLVSGKPPSYDMYTKKDGLQASANVIHSEEVNRVVFEITNNEKALLGTVEENWNYRNMYPFFELYSASHELIATGDFDFWGHTFTLINPNDGHVLATSSSGLFTATYTIHLKEPQFVRQLDPCLFIYVNSLAMDGFVYHNSRMSKNVKSMEHVSTQANQSSLISEIDAYRSLYDGVVPSEEDIDFMKAFTKPLLQEQLDSESSEQDRVEKTISSMIPLLKDTSLTKEQRCALLLLMSQRLKIGQ